MEYKYLREDMSFDYISSLKDTERETLCFELRDKILTTVSNNGGHLASNLGVVELTVALLSVFDYKKDKILFDVGHQAYAYKLLTGRLNSFDTLRMRGGISGFQRISESPYDAFDTGHSSTSISAALGMARAKKLKDDSKYIVAVIGDGALTGGLAYEALNDLGHSKTPMLVILNDNEMSIDKNVGGLSRYLKKLRLSKEYISAKHNTENFLTKHLPVIGIPIKTLMLKTKNFFRFLVNKQVPSMFEDLGLVYYGPIDGHDTKSLIDAINAVKDLEAPVLMHICTKKGKGYDKSEEKPSNYHGVGPFDIKTGVVSSDKETFTSVFGKTIVDIANDNKSVVAITAAMAQGTGLDSFSKAYPDRFFDCGIAEGHAVTMAGGLARAGMTPVVAVYSSFLQRAYDQIIHDVCYMNNHVVFAVDRAGFVGNDGHTHHGMLDISYFNSAPNMTLLAPRDYEGLKLCLDYSINQCDGPVAIRYPRGSSPEFSLSSNSIKPEILFDEGSDFAIVSTGIITSEAIKAASKLKSIGLSGKVIHVTQIKPLPFSEIIKLVSGITSIYTLEEGIVSGGFGESVMREFSIYSNDVSVHTIAVDDSLIKAASVAEQLEEAGIDSDSIVKVITDSIDK